MKGLIEIDNPQYPDLLRKIDLPPVKLYYKGNLDQAIFEKCLAVVGSRRITAYGKFVTNKLVSEAAGSGLTIVSGFMYGVDAAAHRAAIDAGGRTIAVMPCGIDIIHPEYQESLYKDILENNGLIISEFESTHPPALWTYPKRNRIMAALSRATLVIEANLKSGSLITAALAKKYKRKLFAVPGPLTSEVSLGTSQLIKEGAVIVTDIQDILSEYGLSKSALPYTPAKKSSKLNRLEQAIVEKLKQEPMQIDNLSRSINISASQIGAALSLMRIKGLLFEQEGKYYVN